MIGEMSKHRSYRTMTKSVATEIHKRTQLLQVLIVDDDVDAAVLVDSIFHECGCNTVHALDGQEAQRLISAGKIDLIILDWHLGENLTADQVIARTSVFIHKFDSLENKFKNHKPKIISYSSEPSTVIRLPESQYFEHIGHWQKPMKRPELIHRAITLLENLKSKN